MVVDTFDCFGWELYFESQGVTLRPREHSQLNGDVAIVLGCAASAVAANAPDVFDHAVEAVLRDFARHVYVIWYGSNTGSVKERLFPWNETQ